MSDMADVLAKHYPQYRRKNGIDDYGWECTDRTCSFGWTRDFSDAIIHQASVLSAAGFGPVQDNPLEYLVAHSPRLPSDVRNVVFDGVFDVVDKFNFPAQNGGPRADVVDIGDVCGEVEKRIIAILRARALAERGRQ